VRQWVVSVPKRLRGLLADRLLAVAVLTKIFLTEIEWFLLAAAGGTPDADLPRAARPRFGGISFLHRFGSALNRHVHLHAAGSQWRRRAHAAPSSWTGSPISSRRLVNRRRTANTPNLAAQGQSVSRKTVAEMSLTWLS
jgi:hypothetical protein